MNTKLPTQYRSWYAFWIDIKGRADVENHKTIRTPQGGVAISTEDKEVAWLEFEINYIKQKAFDEVEAFLPRTHQELSHMIMSQRLLPGMEEEKPKWFAFHELF